MSNLKNKEQDYGYYSKKLNKVFDTLNDLREAEAEDLRIKQEKEAAANERKKSAEAVENAYKNLNAAKREYKQKLNEALIKHAEALKQLQADFESEKGALIEQLAEAENAYKNELQSFTEKHPEGFHLTLKDGDYETSISSSKTESLNAQSFGDWLISSFFNF